MPDQLDKPERQKPRSNLRRFEVRPSKTYGSFLAAVEPVPPVSAGSRALAAEAMVETVLPEGKEKTVDTTEDRAVWVVHGMGQQVPFETLEQVADGLMGAATRAQAAYQPPGFSEMRVDKTVLQRVELEFTCPDRKRRVVHVYESYWAPKTEGVVNLRDVISLLWNGGWHGLVNCFVGFQRALFSRVVSFHVHWRTPVYLLGVLLVLGSLAAINGIILATGGKSLGIKSVPTLLPWTLVEPLTAVAGVISAVAITFGALLFLATLARPSRFVRNLSESVHQYANPASKVGRVIEKAKGTTKAVDWFYKVVIEWLIWLAVIVTASVVVAGAGVMVYISRGVEAPGWLTKTLQVNAQGLSNSLALLGIGSALLGIAGKKVVALKYNPERGRLSQLLTWYFPLLYIPFCLGFLIFLAEVAGVGWLVCTRGGETWNFPCSCILLSTAWVWPFLVLISAKVRTLMVEYVGDVAAYVSSTKLDRFDAVRKAIKELAKESASAVYLAMADEKTFQYKSVAIVGHSLGSVIAYDTLNRLLADDMLRQPKVGIADRTSVFVTFGSPLDKIAFFFSIMSKKTRHIREQLAALVQPLIQKKEIRRHIPWVNVYTRNDVICGSLDFFDFPQEIKKNPPKDLLPLPREVENVVDEEAVVPLVAHVDYWRNDKVWDEMWKRLWA